jgi:hypothetical protein
MWKRIAVGVLWSLAGYVVDAFAGAFLINALSSNVHDGSVEAAMTGAFVTGPLTALVAFGLSFLLGKRR